MKKRIAIDLTWVRHQKLGGTESSVRNLLDGLLEVDVGEIEFILILSRDNAYSFEKYRNYGCFKLLICNIKSGSQVKRVLWQNVNLGRVLRKNNINICLEPIYSMPFFGVKDIRFITTIHDLQAVHYPEYFSKFRVFWMKLNWENSIKRSYKIISISNYVKNDICNRYMISLNRIEVIYNAVVLNEKECKEECKLQVYGVCKGEYYYTVSSLLPHKNLKTIILAIAKLKQKNSIFMKPLVVSGIGGKGKKEIMKLIKENSIEEDIIFTPFVDNSERNMLYKNCFAFLFPSIFEGFGMPPIEAAGLGVPVITTKCTSLEEITNGILNYVENPFDVDEWIYKMEHSLKRLSENEREELLSKYNRKKTASSYIRLIKNINNSMGEKI